MAPCKKIYFVLAVHNHQPVGNLTEVFQQSFEQTYRPFLSVLEQFPQVKIVLHYSGSLLEWLEENQPEFINRLKKLVGRGQVEILGGGYYEPILPAIPEEDKIGQMRYVQPVEGAVRGNPEGDVAGGTGLGTPSGPSHRPIGPGIPGGG